MSVELWKFVGFIQLFRLTQITLCLEMSLIWGPNSSPGKRLLFTALSHQTQTSRDHVSYFSLAAWVFSPWGEGPWQRGTPPQTSGPAQDLTITHVFVEYLPCGRQSTGHFYTSHTFYRPCLNPTKYETHNDLWEHWDSQWLDSILDQTVLVPVIIIIQLDRTESSLRLWDQRGRLNP